MRAPLDVAKLNLFLEKLGDAAKGPGVVYLTGGASALLHGWREMTVDVDLKFPRSRLECLMRFQD